MNTRRSVAAHPDRRTRHLATREPWKARVALAAAGAWASACA